MTRHLLFWFVLMVIGILNGVLRVETYGYFVPELTAHQISTLTGILICGGVVWLLWKKWPLPTRRDAWIVGVSWLVLTIAFEFGFGHYVAGHSWQRLFADYNLLEGRVWSLFLVWVLFLPVLCHWLRNRPE